MSSELDSLARRFCRELGEDSGRRPMQWRSILLIGVRCRIRAPEVLKELAAYAEKKGWIISKGSHSVCLTDEGTKLGKPRTGMR